MYKSHKNDACISLKDFSYFPPPPLQSRPNLSQVSLVYIYPILTIWVSAWTEWWKQLGPCLTGNHQLLERVLWMKASWAPRGKEEATTNIRTGRCRSDLRHWRQKAHPHAHWEEMYHSWPQRVESLCPWLFVSPNRDSSFMQCYLGDRGMDWLGVWGWQQTSCGELLHRFSIFAIALKTLCITTKRKQNFNLKSTKPAASLLLKEACVSTPWKTRV